MRFLNDLHLKNYNSKLSKHVYENYTKRSEIPKF